MKVLAAIIALVLLVAATAYAQRQPGPSEETKDRLTPEAMEQLVDGPISTLREHGLGVAKAQFEQLRAAEEAANGPNSVRGADLLTAFGVGLFMEANGEVTLLRASRDYLRAAAGSYREAFGSEHPEVAVALHSFADVEIELHNGQLTPQAEAALQEALRIRQITLGPQNRETRAAEERLASLKDTSGAEAEMNLAARALEETARAVEAARELDRN